MQFTITSRRSSVIPFSCSVKTMAEILSMREDYPFRHLERLEDYFLHAIRNQHNLEICLRSGAKIKIDKNGKFYILCYASDFRDGEKAIKELKYLDKLRLAMKAAIKFRNISEEDLRYIFNSRFPLHPSHY